VLGGFSKRPETRAIGQTVERTHGRCTPVKDVAAAWRRDAPCVAPDAHPRLGISLSAPDAGMATVRTGRAIESDNNRETRP